jgi:uncharacterized membrane protein YfcA
MKAVAGLTIVQGFLGCLSGALAHHRFKFVSGPLSLWMGVSITLAAAIGGAGSSYVPDRILLVIFAALALTASLLIFFPARGFPARGDAETHDIKQLNFSRFRAITSATGVGFFGGLVGQGGSFILIPLMTAFVHIPTRIAIGSNLAIVFLSSAAALAGKALTGQIEWLMTIPIALTVIPAAQLGSLASRKAPVVLLRRILATLIGLAALRISITVFAG